MGRLRARRRARVGRVLHVASALALAPRMHNGTAQGGYTLETRRARRVSRATARSWAMHAVCQ